SNEEYESDDLIPNSSDDDLILDSSDDDYNFREDDYFQKNDYVGANLVISHLFAASAASFEKKKCPATYI
ncbi:38348_t:CDS:1, partial [Gigaspora margarita]